jgi:N-acetylmuramoyl-L-alanine amidase
VSLPALVWKPSPNFSRRIARVDLIVLHDCQGGYAGSISWFGQARSSVSAHYVVREDGLEATQMVSLADKAWHAMAFNSRSVGIEMAGYLENGFSPALLDAVARICAYLCQHLQIPIRHARGGVGPGIESHWGLGAIGGGHSDPSTDPKFIETLVAMVAQATMKNDFPLVWEPRESVKACILTPPQIVTATD